MRFDHRDTGASTLGVSGQADYIVEDLANDVIAVLNEHGLDRAHLVGMSLGAFIAQLLALREPNRVRSLTLIATEPLGGDPVDAAGLNPVLLAHFATLSDVDWADPSSAHAFLQRIAVLSASNARGYDQKNADERIEREIERTLDFRAAFNHMTVGGDLDRWNLRNINVPTLVIHGAHDSIIPPANGEAIARQIHGAKLHVLEDAGHELHGDDLGIIAKLIVSHTDDAT